MPTPNTATNNLTQPRLMVQLAHSGPVMSITYSLDGNQLLTTGEDGDAILWDTASGREVQRLFNDFKQTTALALFNDASLFIAGDSRGDISIWDTQTRKMRNQIAPEGKRNKASRVNALHLSPDESMWAAGYSNGHAILVDTQTGQIIHALMPRIGKKNEHVNGRSSRNPIEWQGITALVFSKNGSRLLLGCEDGKIRVYNVHSGEEILALQGHMDSVGALAVSQNNQYAVSGAKDGTAHLWDISALPEAKVRAPITKAGQVGLSVIKFAFRSILKIIGGIFAFIFGLIISGLLRLPGMNFGQMGFGAISRLVDEKVNIVSSKELLLKIKAMDYPVKRIGFSHDNRQIITWNNWQRSHWTLEGQSAGSWDAPGTDTEPQHTAAVFSADGACLAIGHRDGTISQLAQDAPENARLMARHADAILSGAFSKDGSHLLLGYDYHKSARLWNIRSGKEIQHLEGHHAGIKTVACSPNGLLALTGSNDKTVRLWNLSTGKPMQRIDDFKKNKKKDIDSVAFISEGQRFTITSTDQETRVYDTETGNRVHFSAVKDGHLHGAIELPNGHLVASDNRYGFTLRDPNTGEVKQRFRSKYDVRSYIRNEGIMGLFILGIILIIIWSLVLSGSPFLQSSDVNDSGVMKYVGMGILVLLSGATVLGFIHSIMVFAFGRTLLLMKKKHNYNVNITVFPDGKKILRRAGHQNKTQLWDIEDGTCLLTIKDLGETAPSAIDENHVLSKHEDNSIRVWDVKKKRAVQRFEGYFGTPALFAPSPDGKRVLTAGDDAITRLWDTQTGRELCRLVSFIDGSWVVLNNDGRFDTNNLESLKGIHWIMADDPLRPLPLEIFMQAYFEPGLLPKLLNGVDMPVLPELASLNRVQPILSFISVTAVQDNPQNPHARIEIALRSDSRTFQRNGTVETIESGAYDLHLFRDGQLVQIKKGNLLPNGQEKVLIQFDGIALPLNGKQEVVFTAYAFNSDRVKSITQKEVLVTSEAVVAKKPRAYVIAVGINEYEDSSWNLNYAANDARGMLTSLEDHIPLYNDYEVLSIGLFSENGKSNATKAHFTALIDKLAGRQPTNPSLLVDIPGSASIQAARPEDLIVFSFAGHGYSSEGQIGERGDFYFLFSDIGEQASLSDALLERTVSSQELTQWLEDVDAGDMAFIIDACHSAASVESEGFKPGPMGSNGLGQMAYNKGMLVLAASAADDVALEIASLQKGLLTYALVEEGLNQRRADFGSEDLQHSDGRIEFSEWLHYAASRVPQLCEEILNGKHQGLRFVRKADQRGERVYKEPEALPVQQPAVFDFRKRKEDIVLWQQAS